MVNQCESIFKGSNGKNVRGNKPSLFSAETMDILSSGSTILIVAFIFLGYAWTHFSDSIGAWIFSVFAIGFIGLILFLMMFIIKSSLKDRKINSVLAPVSQSNLSQYNSLDSFMLVGNIVVSAVTLYLISNVSEHDFFTIALGILSVFGIITAFLAVRLKISSLKNS